jgi:uncharacterized protein (TIGR03086 family)
VDIRCRPIYLLTRTSDAFMLRLALVQPHQWIAPTPCTEWDVLALVNHVVGANRRYTMLLHGAAVDEVEATRTADHLRDDSASSFAATAAELRAAFCEPGALTRSTHHATGERTGAQLLAMRVLDIAVHTWDLARSIGADEALDADAVAFALTLRDTVEAGRARGSFAPATETSAGASPQARLLHLCGRRPDVLTPFSRTRTPCS